MKPFLAILLLTAACGTPVEPAPAAKCTEPSTDALACTCESGGPGIRRCTDGAYTSCACNSPDAGSCKPKCADEICGSSPTADAGCATACASGSECVWTGCAKYPCGCELGSGPNANSVYIDCLTACKTQEGLCCQDYTGRYPKDGCRRKQ